MTHKQARRKLGSRSVRRAGVDVKRARSGSMRKSTKPRVAAAVRALLKAAGR